MSSRENPLLRLQKGKKKKTATKKVPIKSPELVKTPPVKPVKPTKPKEAKEKKPRKPRTKKPKTEKVEPTITQEKVETVKKEEIEQFGNKKDQEIIVAPTTDLLPSIEELFVRFLGKKMLDLDDMLKDFNTDRSKDVEDLKTLIDEKYGNLAQSVANLNQTLTHLKEQIKNSEPSTSVEQNIPTNNTNQIVQSLSNLEGMQFEYAKKLYFALKNGDHLNLPELRTLRDAVGLTRSHEKSGRYKQSYLRLLLEKGKEMFE